MEQVSVARGRALEQSLLPPLISLVLGAETGYGASERRPGTGLGAEFATAAPAAHQPRPRGGDRLWSK